MLCLMWRLRCCSSRSIPASATSWCVCGRLGLTILGSRERARVAVILALAIRTRQRTVAFDLACFAQITCCRDAIESSPFLRPRDVHVQIQRVRRVTEMEVDGRKRSKASDGSLQRAGRRNKTSDVPGLNGTWQHTNSLSWLHSVSIIPSDIVRYLCDFITWTW
jgi:hypothetical protein